MLKYFIEKFRSFRGEYMNRSPKAKWLFILRVVILVQKALGASVLDKHFKVWWYTYVSGIAFLDFALSVVYTYYYYSEQPIKGLLFISSAGIFVPAMMIYTSIFDPAHKREYHAIVYFSGEQIYPDYNTECSTKYMKIAEQSVSKLLLNAAKVTGIIYFSSWIFLVFSIIAYYVKNEIQLPIPVLFPFTDLESMNGLAINLVNQSFMAFMIIGGNIGIELSSCMMKNSVWISAAAICHSIEEITEKLEECDDVANDYFRNIIIQFQDFDRFIMRIGRVFYWRLLFKPFLLSFGVTISLFFYLSGVWLSGAGSALFSYSLLYIPCDFGNEVTSANDTLSKSLQQMPWYLMSIEYQLAYAHLLNRVQNGSVIRMGPFATLDFQTLSHMTNRIYTFLMMLLRMLN